MWRLLRRYERNRRFWKRVRVRGVHECWRWEGEVGPDGEAWFAGRPARERAFELARGPMPRGARLERRCGDTRCVNPDHLELSPP